MAAGSFIGNLVFPVFGAAIGGAVGGFVGGALGDYSTQRLVEKKENAQVKWANVAFNGLFGGLTAGAGGYLQVARNLIQKGAQKTGEALQANLLGRVAQFLIPTTQLTWKGFYKRATVNALLGAAEGGATMVFDKDAKAEDVLKEMLASVILGESIDLGVKAFSKMNLNRALKEGTESIDEAIGKLKPEENLTISVNQNGQVILASTEGRLKEMTESKLLATVRRNGDNKIEIATTELANKIQEPQATKAHLSSEQNKYRSETI